MTTRKFASRRALPLLTTLIAVACALPGAWAAPKDDSAWYLESQQNEGAAMQYLWRVLRSARKSGRVNFPAYCPPADGDRMVFPKIAVQPPPEGTSGLAAVQGIFPNNKDILVGEDADGIIRVTIGHVSEAVLHTPIAKLAFDPTSQYNEWAAIDFIVWSDEVQKAMSDLKLRTPIKVYGIPVIGPDESRPHLPALVSNVTMDQALNLVTKTFDGIVLYGACENSNLYDVTVFYGYVPPT